MNIDASAAFMPRGYQRPFMRHIENGGKRAFVVWPRRHGKDLTAAQQTCRMMHRRVGVYWHFWPTLEQGRRGLWEAYRADGTRTLEGIFPGFTDPGRKGSIVLRKNEQQMFVELKNGSLWRLMGTDKIESVGAGPVGVVFSEFALSKPKAWDLTRPMLRENGGWAVFITTPRGNNHAKKLYDRAKTSPGWYHDLKTVYQTKQRFASVNDPSQMLSPDEMMEEERQSGMPEALIQQEYLCDWNAANVGSVFGSLMPEAILYEHPRDGVYTSWDLGISDATAVWFWRIADGSIDFIDFIEESGKPFEYFADEVDGRGYAYLMHWLPHDARARTFVSGTSVQEAAHARWGAKVGITPGLSLADGIQAGRWLLQLKPRFHPRTEQGIEALKAYHYEWDEDRKVLANTPLHDWSSHPADAFRYAAVVARTAMRLARPKAPPVPPTVMLPNEGHRLDDLWKSSRSGGRERI